VRRLPALALTLLLAALAAPSIAADDAAAYVPVRQDPLGTRLVNLPSPLTLGRGTFEILFTHRFAEAIGDGSAHDLWGLDGGADVGIGLGYGVSRNFDLALYRSSFAETYELAGTVALLRQAPRVPLSFTVRAGADLVGQRGADSPTRPFAQAIVARRFASGWNVIVVPTWVRDTPRLRNAFNAGLALSAPLGGARLELEVMPRNRDLASSVTAWSIALSKAIGGHLFKLTLGNSRATTVDQYAGGDFPPGFRTHDVRLGFNLVRDFHPGRQGAHP